MVICVPINREILVSRERICMVGRASADIWRVLTKAQQLSGLQTRLEGDGCRSCNYVASYRIFER